MFYKNLSNSVKTFYGITFKPGDIKEVPGFINNKYMIVVDEPKQPAKPQQPKPSPVAEKKPEPKKEQQSSSEANKEATASAE